MDPMDFGELPDLAARTLGGSVVVANDEFFAERENLINPAPPEFNPSTFGHKGQVYDGWETRRRRQPGHDHAIVRLGTPGVIRGIVVDTAFFTGNFPEQCSVEAASIPGYPSPDELYGQDVEWVELVPKTSLKGNARNPFSVASEQRFTHVRLNIFPDGGVARLRVHGVVVPDPRWFEGVPLDLAALETGGVVEDCSNMFYSSPNNLLLPGETRVMGEGWETARRREGGNDWVLVRRADDGSIRQVVNDTTHFKGNAPAAFRLAGGTRARPSDEWAEILPLPDEVTVLESGLAEDVDGVANCVAAMQAQSSVSELSASYRAALDEEGWDYVLEEETEMQAMYRLQGPECGFLLFMPGDPTAAGGEEDGQAAMVVAQLIPCEHMPPEDMTPPGE
jgi:allantoicase